MILLIYPQIGILNEILLLFAVVILRHRPEIKIFVRWIALTSIVVLLLGIGCFLLGLEVGIAYHSSSHHESLILELGEFSPELFVLFDKFALLASVFIDFSVLFLDKLSHFLYLLLKFAVF